MIKNTTPLEEDEQKTFIDWMEARKLKFSALPLSTYTTSWNQKRKNHEMGVRVGVPDVMVITPQGLVFVELKRRKGSKTDPEQKKWVEELNKCPGVEAKICFGCDEAIAFVNQFL